MTVDLDRCTGCQACVVACQAENNLPINTKAFFQQRRAYEWIRIERYWEGEFPNVKAKFIPILCQHCENAPCEPVCPVFAAYRTPDGLNAQIYNRCVGTRYCSNNCPYKVRYFNWFEHSDPSYATYSFAEPLQLQLNPDVTVRSKGVMEKCTFCVQRIQDAQDTAKAEGRGVRDGEIQPACAQSCASGAIVFGDIEDRSSRVRKLARSDRGYRLLEDLGAKPSVVYLKARREE